MPEVFPNELHSAVSLGILLLASLVGGIVADMVRIPKVTTYLLAGMLVGPSVLHAINDEHINLLRKNVSGIPRTADFDEVVAYIRRSHDNTYVVVDSQQCVAGVIRYGVLSETFF